MSHRWRAPLVLIAFLAATPLLPHATASAQTGTGPAVAGPAAAGAFGDLTPLTSQSAERVLLADKVAAAKWGTDQPIEDPEREQRVLDDVAHRSVGMGIDPVAATRFFRDQIEASKLVQRGLHDRWATHPDEVPAERPDLPTEVRPALDRLTTDLLGQLRDTSTTRRHPSCQGRLVISFQRVDRDKHLDALHGVGLARSLPSVCAPAR